MSQTKSGWLLLLGGLGMVIVLALGALIAGRIQRAGDKNLCDLIAAQIRVYAETPPGTPTGQALARAWDNLRDRYECERTGS